MSGTKFEVKFEMPRDLEANLGLAIAEGQTEGLMRIGQLTAGAAKQIASGRPGPNVITGHLRGSIVAWPERPRDDVFVGVAEPGPAAAYAGRIEKLYPFISPAMHQVEGRLGEIMGGALREALAKRGR